MTEAPIALGERSSILVILMGALGDIARGVCVLEPIKRRYPDCTVTWLVEPKWRGFLKLQSSIDEIIVFDRPRGVRAIYPLWQQLRSRHFDLTLDLQRHFKSGFFSWLSGAPRRIGFHPKNAKEYNWLFNTDHCPRYVEGTSKVEHYLAFCRMVGVEPESSVSFGLSEEVYRAAAGPKLSTDRRQLIGILLGSSWESKDWVVEGYEKLCRRLIDQAGKTVVLLGDSSQTGTAQKLVELLPAEHTVSLVGDTNLVELTGVIAECVGVVGPDSGPGHIASAVGTPYVSLFGPTDHGRVAPYGAEDLVVRAQLACAPCLRRTCPGLDRLCMRLIRVDDIFQALERSGALPVSRGPEAVA